MSDQWVRHTAMMLSSVEQRWLDYAWSVVSCPAAHRRACTQTGGAVPGPGRVDGNELRWPGYLGREYVEERSVLCVGAVHRESSPGMEMSDPIIAATNGRLAAESRAWLATGRSAAADERYLRGLRDTYEVALPRWGRWQRHFRTLIEDHLGMGVTAIAWTNLAKCRVSIDRGSRQRTAEAQLTRLCQRQFPVRDLVAAIRPVAVLSPVLGARPGGEIVARWDNGDWSPPVWTWQGQSGHDRHNTAPGARRLTEWAPEMAAAIRGALSCASPPGGHP